MRWVAGNPDIRGDIPWENIWLGVSVENQDAADERIPILLDTPAAVRFISAEPLLGPVDLARVPGYPLSLYREAELVTERMMPSGISFTRSGRGLQRFSREPLLHWVIAGGESGPNYRPMDLDWARSLRDQCIAAGVAFFFKQESGRRPESNPVLDGQVWHQFPALDRS